MSARGKKQARCQGCLWVGVRVPTSTAPCPWCGGMNIVQVKPPGPRTQTWAEAASSTTLRDRLEHLIASAEDIPPTPTTVMVAFTLMMEEPGLPPEVALLAAEEGGPFLGPIVDPIELLRLAAVGYRLEQT